MNRMFRMNKSEFDKLKSDIYDNQNNKDFKIIKKTKKHMI